MRTPRLELRCGTGDELLALRELARGGIHPPDFMPFAVPWTEQAGDEDFVVGYYELQLARWQPDDWVLDLLVWAGDTLVGAQGLRSAGFADTRTVDTGSWLGLPHQRRGYGTEMRTAILELAFRGLGAERATSGAFDGNDASARVSEKLGYQVAARVPHGEESERRWETRYELRRADWHAPLPVAIGGLEPALPLFGLPR